MPREPMTQHQFLSRLLAGVSSLPAERIREIEDDIRRHFDEGRANGEDDGKLAAMLGDPDVLAREYNALYEAETGPQAAAAEEPGDEAASSEPFRERGTGGKIGVGIALFFLDLCVAFPAWALLGSVWLVLASGILILLAGALALVLLFVNSVFPIPWISMEYPLFGFFATVTCISFGGLLCIGAYWYGKAFLRWTRSYLAFHSRVFAGRKVQ